MSAESAEIRVSVADYAVSARGTISTIGLGSCVAIVLHDAAARVGLGRAEHLQSVAEALGHLGERVPVELNLVGAHRVHAVDEEFPSGLAVGTTVVIVLRGRRQRQCEHDGEHRRHDANHNF